MSVASKNPFALLNDDDEVEQTSVAVAVPSSAVKPSEKPQPKAQENRQQRQGQHANGRAPRAPRAEKTSDGFEVKEGRGERRERGGRGERGEGRGRGRGGRGRGRGGFQDRHSNTGIVDSEKQVNQGWGAETGAAEQAAETQGAADAAKEATAPEGAEPAATTGEATEAAAGGEAKANAEEAENRARFEEEEDKTLSYDEWLKKQKETSGGLDGLVPKIEPRKVGEGEGYEDGVLKTEGAVLKKAEEEFFAGKAKKGPASKPKKEKPQTIEIEARFAPVERGGRGRGGRGGERGAPRGGRGEGRGGRGGNAPRGRGAPRGGAGRGVDVDDAAAFPSLTA